MKMEQTECSETSEYKIQTPGNHPKETIQHSGQGESLKSGILMFYVSLKAPFYDKGSHPSYFGWFASFTWKNNGIWYT